MDAREHEKIATDVLLVMLQGGHQPNSGALAVAIVDEVIKPLLITARREAYGQGRDDEADGLELRDQTEVG